MKKGKKNKRVNLFEKHIDEQIQTLNTSTKKELEYELDHFQDREWKDELQMHAKTPSLPALEHGEDHAMPKTRREFIEHGLLGTTLTLTAPSLFMPSAAQALTCPDAGNGADRLPLLVIDCRAGASFMGVNILPGATGVGNPENDPLAPGAYAAFGVPSAEEPQNAGTPTRFFGAGSQMVWHPRSVIGQNIVANAGGAEVNMDGITVACSSDDDTGNNVLNISQAIVEAGIRGELAGAIGTQNTASGGRSQSLLANPGNASTQVQDAAQAQGLVNPGDLLTGLGGDNASAQFALRQIASLTEAQTNFMKSKMASGDAKTAIACGAQQNVANLDPTQNDFTNMYNDPMVSTVFGAGLGQNGNNDDTDMAVAAGVFLALNGKVGAATVEIGGCDYHAVSAQGQIAKDREIGRAIGTAVQMASIANQPLAIYLLSDGSASANGNDRGDQLFRQNVENGNFASLHLFVYNPAGRPTVVKPQLGAFTANGVLQDGTHPWATSPSAAAQVIAANYLYLAGQENKLGVLGNLPADFANVLQAFGAPIIS